MRERRCHRGGGSRQGPCTCEMGNLYRFAEPIVLLAIARLGGAHGYQIAQEAEGMSVTHAGLDGGVVYRTLRNMEAAGRVSSRWDTSGSGPARRVYTLTESGIEHLREWAQVLRNVSGALLSLTNQCGQAARQQLRSVSSTEARDRAAAAVGTGQLPRNLGDRQ
jgi:PadR family transcriptional regulator PadR